MRFFGSRCYMIAPAPLNERTRAHICADVSHAICGPRFPRPLGLSSGAELTPASVNPGMPSARTQIPHSHIAACIVMQSLICPTLRLQPNPPRYLGRTPTFKLEWYAIACLKQWPHRAALVSPPHRPRARPMLAPAARPSWHTLPLSSSDLRRPRRLPAHTCFSVTLCDTCS